MRVCAFLFMIGLTVWSAGCGNKSEDESGGGGGGGGGGPPSDSSALQGEWEEDGKELSYIFRLKIEGNKVQVIGIQHSGSFTFTLDPGKNPKWMTLTRVAGTGKSGPKDGPGSDQPLEWIYELKGDKLQIALPSYGSGPRPTEFKDTTRGPMTPSPNDGPPQTPVALAKLKKVQPKVPASPSVSGAGGTDTDRAPLQGKWKITKVEMPPGPDTAKEQQFINEMLGKISVTIERDTITATIAGEGPKPWKASYKIDKSKSPAHVDIVETARDDAPPGLTPETFQGIYRVEGRTITLAIALGSKAPPRPNQFRPSGTKEDKGGVIVVTLQKQ